MIRIREDELIENRWECHSEGRSALCFAFHGGALGAWKKRRARTCRALPGVARRLPPLLLTKSTTTFCPLRFRDIYLQKFELFLGFGAHKAAVDSKRKLLLVAK